MGKTNDGLADPFVVVRLLPMKRYVLLLPLPAFYSTKVYIYIYICDFMLIL